VGLMRGLNRGPGLRWRCLCLQVVGETGDSTTNCERFVFVSVS
jgi:hypothetical protein